MRRRRCARRETTREGRRKKIERDLNFFRCRRNLEMKRIHVHVIAPPGDRFSARGDFQTRKIDDRPRRSMFSGNPLRINQRH